MNKMIKRLGGTVTALYISIKLRKTGKILKYEEVQNYGALNHYKLCDSVKLIGDRWVVYRTAKYDRKQNRITYWYDKDLMKLLSRFDDELRYELETCKECDRPVEKIYYSK